MPLFVDNFDIKTNIERKILNGLFKLIYLSDTGCNIDDIIKPFFIALFLKIHQKNFELSDIFKILSEVSKITKMFEGSIYPELSSNTTAALFSIVGVDELDKKTKEKYEMNLKQISKLYGIELDQPLYEFL